MAYTNDDNGLGIYLLLCGHSCLRIPNNDCTGFFLIVFCLIEICEPRVPLNLIPVPWGGLGSLSFEASVAHLFEVSVSLSENTMALRNYSVVSLKVTNDRRFHSLNM